MHRRLASTSAAILIAITLSACATASGDSYCRIADPITFSDLDTAETRAQIEEHNAEWVCACEHDCPDAP